VSGHFAEVVAGHPYFFSNLPLCGLVVAITCLKRETRYRRVAFFSGFACMFCCPLWMPFEDYWHPVLLFKPPWRIEDLVYQYWTGSAAWIAAAVWLRPEWVVGVRSTAAALLRMLPLALGAALFVALWLAGMNVMTACILSEGVMLLLLLGRRRSLWRLALAGMITYTPFYAMVVKIQFALWPSYVSYWSPAYPWGRTILGIPSGEIASALSFSGMWPTLIAWALDIRGGQEASKPCAMASPVGLL
jgi:hypothetical protein